MLWFRGFENELWVFLSSTDPHAGNEGGKSNEILQKIPAKGLLGELVGVTEIQDGGGRVVWSDGWGRRFSCYFLDLLGYQCGIHQKNNGEK